MPPKRVKVEASVEDDVPPPSPRPRVRERGEEEKKPEPTATSRVLHAGAKRTYDVSPAVVESRKRAGEAAKAKRASDAAARDEERKLTREAVEILREMREAKRAKEAKRMAPAATVEVTKQSALPPPPADNDGPPRVHNAPAGGAHAGHKDVLARAPERSKSIYSSSDEDEEPSRRRRGRRPY